MTIITQAPTERLVAVPVPTTPLTAADGASSSAPSVARWSDVRRSDVAYERCVAELGDRVLPPGGAGDCDVLLVRTDHPRVGLRAAWQDVGRQVPTVVVTAARDSAELLGVVSAGAEGCLVDGYYDAADLERAFRCAPQARPTWSGPVVEAVVDRLARLRGRAPASRCAALSERQREILELVAAGLGNGEIATRLFLSEKTVRNHVHNIYRVLGCTTRAEAMSCWHRAESLAQGAAR